MDLVKTTFRALLLVSGCLIYTALSSTLFAALDYPALDNGEVLLFEQRLYTKVVFQKEAFTKNRNQKSIAKLNGLSNFLEYPLTQLNWSDEFTHSDRTLLIKNYFRITKNTSTIKGFRSEKQWASNKHYNYIYSIPIEQIDTVTVDSSEVVSEVRDALLNGSEKLDRLAILDISYRHPQLFDRSSLQLFLNKEFNHRYGTNLLMVLLGIGNPIESSLLWSGTEASLLDLGLDNLLLLLSENPFNNLIIYRVVILLKAGEYHSVNQSLLNSVFKRPSQGAFYGPLINLANTLNYESN